MCHTKHALVCDGVAHASSVQLVRQYDYTTTHKHSHTHPFTVLINDRK